MKKLALAAIGIAAALLITGVQAREWGTHKVKIAGVTIDGSTYLRAMRNVDGTEIETLYRVHDGIKNSGLAIGLAAVSSNRKVMIYSNVDESPAGQPVITSMYLTDQVAN